MIRILASCLGVAAVVLAGLVSCVTPTSAPRYWVTYAAIGTPQTAVVQDPGFTWGMFDYTYGVTLVRLTLVNTLGTPVQIRWQDSQIEAGGTRSPVFLTSEEDYADVAAQPVVIVGHDTLTDGLLAKGDVRLRCVVCANRDASTSGVGDYELVPMPDGPMQIYLVYNDTPGFEGTSKALTITLTPGAGNESSAVAKQ